MITLAEITWPDVALVALAVVLVCFLAWIDRDK